MNDHRPGVAGDDETAAALPPRAAPPAPAPPRAATFLFLAPPPPMGSTGRGAAMQDTMADPIPEGNLPYNSSSGVQLLLHKRGFGFGKAASVLEDVSDGPIRELVVFALEPWAALSEDDDGGQMERVDTPSFRRFVNMLDTKGGRTLLRLKLYEDMRGLPDDDMERLFRHVLPSHPTLKHIEFKIMKLPARFLRMLTEALPTESKTPLSSLAFTRLSHNPENQAEVVDAIVGMLKRNAAIRELSVSIHLEAEQCKLICQAVSRNTSLRTLDLWVKEIFADTLDGVGTSSLRSLRVSGSFSEDAVPSLAKQLRTNEKLWDLALGRTSYCDSLALLAKTYNHTLRSVGYELDRSPDRDRFGGYMMRNRQIRHGLRQLEDPSRRVVIPALLPNVLGWGVWKDRPTLLYRIVKKHLPRVVSDRLAAQAVGENPPRPNPAPTCDVRLVANGFREAVNALEGVPGRPIDLLCLTDVEPTARADDALSFPRFVTVLGQRESGVAVRQIIFKVDWSKLPSVDVDRLFLDVLPNHETRWAIRPS